MRKIVVSGWGYWDVTNYPYGGCFRRLTADTEVTILESCPRQETKIRFDDGRIGVITNRAFSVYPCPQED